MSIADIKWKLFSLKSRAVYLNGLKTRKIVPYSEQMIEKFRNVSYGGIPASIILLNVVLCNGKCYDRSVLFAATLDEDIDFRIIRGKVDAIKLNPKYNGENDPLFADHCFVEITDRDNEVWICDTSLGLLFEKELYYKLENVEERHISTKEDTINFCEYQDIKNNCRFEDDKYMSLLTLPIIEDIAQKDNDNFYHDQLLREIELYKKKINYDGLIDERNNHFKNRTKKFGE